MVEYNWKIAEPSVKEQDLCVKLMGELQISHTMAWLLVKRGIITAEQARAYIRPGTQPLHDPFLMQDMSKAVARLEKALQNNEKILVFGDYDVDGVTSVALMVHFLRYIKIEHITYIPDRKTEGYGLSMKGVDCAISNGCSLIIALDCGIRDNDRIQYALDNGIDTIVCDHHNVGDILPPATAVLDIKRSDCSYPYKDLSGCGVGFKFVQAYCQKNDIDFGVIRPLLQLVALSTACDLVSMNGENRIMEVIGIEQMQTQPLLGIQMLLMVSQTDPTKITTDDLGFRIGPRINASGRLYTAADALQLLVTDNVEEAMNLARKLDKYNEERQDEENRIAQEAMQILENLPNKDELYSTVVFSPNWNQGVVGITASLLTEHYYRPTIVLTEDSNGLVTGSARSVGSVNIYNAIEANKDLLVRFGGHSFAAGMTLPKDNLDAFRNGFEHYLATHISKEDLIPVINADAEIELSEIDDKLQQVVACLAPFGTNNKQPIFISRHLYDSGNSQCVGKNDKHLKLSLTDNNGHFINGIAFGKGDWIAYIKTRQPFSLCYKVDKNTFNGKTSIQLVVIDIKPEA